MYENVLLDFGKTVRTLRQAKNISQEQLGDLCGLHRTYISDIELGKRNVSFENIIRLSVALGIKVSDLFIEVEKNESI